ncbi:LLM class flavin-dependent oxidoreductase [Kocuria sp. TGY1127_2]|uniref:LLM class flavin-dependent oxidoreductase n=1 Tax=Kocuria sp. TGY1127_2 TaxID=2711328 RepID=UPI0015BBAD4C|nr:LLM class flavin-dependent oxidoreductase [Kocuria sp. TGY1127_2]
MSQRQVHLAAHFPGVNNTTVWSDPKSGSNIDFSSFKHFSRTAERGLFDFVFLAEGLRLREHKGKVFDLDTVGRPETVTVLSALAAVTEHIGFAGTLSATFNEPYDLARKLATLDHVSGGRAAWNVVTTNDAFTGENFRRGGYLDYADRYRRAVDFISAARQMWESDAGPFEFSSEFFDIAGRFPVHKTPQTHPVLFQAGDSPTGRDFACANADAIFTRHSGLEGGQEFYADISDRLARFGRSKDDLSIYPGVTYIIGDTHEDAVERSRQVAFQQVSGPGAIAFLERQWGKDLSAYDPDGPLPDIEPDFESESLTQGRVRRVKDPRPVVEEWRRLARDKNLSIRELVVEVSGQHSFVGTPAEIAGQMDLYVQERAADGFILIPHLTPGGLDEFVDRVVPELRSRGVYRDGYPGRTLRKNMGLPDYRPEKEWAASRERADESREEN